MKSLLLSVFFGLVGIALGAGFVYATTTHETVFMDGRLIFSEGGIQANAYEGYERPTCDYSMAGTFWYTNGDNFVADKMELCTKNVLNNYVWLNIVGL